MDYSKVSKLEGIAFLVIVMLNHLVLDLPKNFLENCGTSAPLNIIFITCIVFVFLCLILKLWDKFSGQDILDISNFLGGKFLKSIVGIAFAIHFLAISSILLRNFSEVLTLTYFEEVPLKLILVVLIIPVIISNKLNFKNIFRINLIITAFMLINLTVSFALVSPRFDIEKLFPILGLGVNQTFFSGISNIFAFSGIAYLYFLMPLLKSYKQFNKISFWGIAISSLYLFISVLCLLLSFSGIKFINELSPVYFLIKSAEISKFFQRPDSIFLFSWILSIMSYLSIVILVISIIFKKLTHIENQHAMSYSFGLILLILSFIPQNMSQINFFENVIFKYSSIFIIFILGFLILLFANLKYKLIHKHTKGELDDK